MTSLDAVSLRRTRITGNILLGWTAMMVRMHRPGARRDVGRSRKSWSTTNDGSGQETEGMLDTRGKAEAQQMTDQDMRQKGCWTLEEKLKHNKWRMRTWDRRDVERSRKNWSWTKDGSGILSNPWSEGDEWSILTRKGWLVDRLMRVGIENELRHGSGIEMSRRDVGSVVGPDLRQLAGA